MEEPYVVLTAAHTDRNNPSRSITELLELNAKLIPNSMAVGFCGLESTRNLSYSELLELVVKLANYYVELNLLPIRKDLSDNITIGLLSPSCFEFLITLLAASRLGLAVLLIAPQNTPAQILNLLEKTGASHLIYQFSLKSQALATLELESSTKVIGFEIPKEEIWSKTNYKNVKSSLSFEDEAKTTCVILHSSGSSGMPKPLPQTHELWSGSVVPCLPTTKISYSTTPLFHGGISDLFRSMNSKSFIYLFPSTLPITAKNLVRSMEILNDGEKPNYFLSVPYILKMLVENEEGMKLLKSFDLVSVGGAPLPVELGNMMVKEGIKLVSRYGSSECGFLLTSHRGYETDLEWNYLRVTSAAMNRLKFELFQEDQYELVVPSDWSSKSSVAVNQVDGSYRTSDLFIKHETIVNAWKLIGRADDVLLMLNGEKTSPVPMENELIKSELIKDCVVFGKNQIAIGVLIIPMRDDVTINDLWNDVIKTNLIAPTHSQLLPELCIILKSSSTFPKASKGTLQRNQTYIDCDKEITKAYERFEGLDSTVHKISLEGIELLNYVMNLVVQTIRPTTEFTEDTELFSFGVNSLQSVRIRNLLQRNIDLGKGKLSSNVVYECSTIKKLVEHIEALRLGKESDPESKDSQDLILMKTYLDQLCIKSLDTKSATPPSTLSNKLNIILTGASGALGAHLLSQLSMLPQMSSITCLVRADSNSHAKERIEKSVSLRKLALIEDDRISYLNSNLSDENLGLEKEVYEKLLRQTNLIIHAAWPVNFVGGLSGFEPSLIGLKNLLKFTQSTFYFCSSTASVLSNYQNPIPESIPPGLKSAVPMGYARSKLIAELLVKNSFENGRKGNVGVLRIGQLCGDRKEGVWNEMEGWPMLISSAELCGSLPNLDEKLSWLPVDSAAKAIIDISTNLQSLANSDEIPVFHIVNTNEITSFKTILIWLKEIGLKFDVVEPPEWIQKLIELESKGSNHSCLKLLDLWTTAYGNPIKSTESNKSPIFQITNGAEFSKVLAEPEGISKEWIEEFIKSWKESGFLQ